MGATTHLQQSDERTRALKSSAAGGQPQPGDARVPGEHHAEERQSAGGAGPSGPAHRLDKYTTNLHTHPQDAAICDGVKQTYFHPDSRYAAKRRKQKGRAYWTILSAMNWYKSDASWWLTLTSAPGTRPIEKSWNALRTRIDRTTRQEIIDWLLDSKRPGFTKKEQRYCLSFYVGKERDQVIEFKYIAIKTSEGNGVYHMFIFGDMLPASWLRHWWKKYHGGSDQLDIHRIKDTSESKGKLTRYALTQYAAGQDQFVRMSHSDDLLYRHARRDWLDLVHAKGYDQAKAIWSDCMLHHSTPDQWHRRFAYAGPTVAKVRLHQPGDHQQLEIDQEVIHGP